MLNIIGAGLGRTGTLSLHFALEQLGFKSIHFDQERLNDVLDGTNNAPDFRRYDDVDAVLDVPTAYFYRELFKAYPDARVILTIRDTDTWWRSTDWVFNTVRPVSMLPRLKYRVAEKLGLKRWFVEPEAETFRRNLRNRIYGSTVATEFIYKRKFEQHNASVIAEIPKERLLVMDITGGDGWAKLCAFLGVEAPDMPFPHAHKTVA